jgi:hypothetical protein
MKLMMSDQTKEMITDKQTSIVLDLPLRRRWLSWIDEGNL